VAQKGLGVALGSGSSPGGSRADLGPSRAECGRPNQRAVGRPHQRVPSGVDRARNQRPPPGRARSTSRVGRMIRKGVAPRGPALAGNQGYDNGIRTEGGVLI